VLFARPGDYVTAGGGTRSLCLYVKTTGAFDPVAPADILPSHLGDDGPTWAHLPPAGKYAVDPVLGRIALPAGLPAGTDVRVDFHYGFSADLGGGEYPRAASFETAEPPPQLLKVPADHATIQAALNALAGAGVVEITDSGRYEETLAVSAAAGKRIELRAADKRRPTLILSGPLALSGGADSEIRLNGLLIAGQGLEVTAGAGNALARLRLSHCTLVPGLTLSADGTPLSPAAASLEVKRDGVAVTIERTIAGGVRAVAKSTVAARDSIIDATSTTRVAYAAPDGSAAGGPLSLDACTLIGKVHALKLPLVSNAILLADLAPGDAWKAPVIAARRQEGCVRFSYLPASALVPRRHQCLPEAAPSPLLALPRFTSLRYGVPAYCQLATSSGAQLLRGADDEGQPGAFHFLYQPQRETNLRVRLDEYLRASLEAGIFYES
jgi:hypothetical protein